ncbi:MAG: DUF4199 domain-containing protein [Flavobacterium sp.]|uniref:DUF4199 domain-containing protein n=1 Tax=Flavobacterium sp. TaxID=239 RepID=UPI00120F79A3|nr:DUF4199 domain-containing protein [Flavobacterium sp.]RZJ65235.1 MAG: DUF4199 domain-containing protein [Flavobacterium sp.]
MKKFSIEIKWGILLTLLLIASAIVEKEMGLYQKPDFTYFLLSPLAFAPFGMFIYVMFYREKKKDYFNGNMNWRQGFFAGLMLTAIVTVLVPVQKNVIHRVIAPELFENTITEMTAKGKRTRVEAEEYANMSSSIYNGMQLVLSSGVVASAMLSLLYRNKTK